MRVCWLMNDDEEMKSAMTTTLFCCHSQSLVNCSSFLLFSSKTKPNQTRVEAFLVPLLLRPPTDYLCLFPLLQCLLIAPSLSPCFSLNPFSLLVKITFPSFSSSFIFFPLSLYLCNSIHTWNFSLKLHYYSTIVLYCSCFCHPCFFLTPFMRKLPFSFSLIFLSHLP